MVRVLRPLPAESLKLLVFDLDGTLIDSARDLCNSVNATLVEFDREPLPDPIVASYIGDGAVMLVRRALFGVHATEVDEDFLARAYAYFLDYYREHKLDFTYAYQGVVEALASVRALPQGTARTMSVLTNKPVRPAQAICEALDLAPYFLHVYGGNSFPLKKPDPMGLRALMEEAGARPEETVLIGDSEVDVATARNAGTWVIGCTFGLAPDSLTANPPDVLVDSPAEWTAVLNPSQQTLPRFA
ncbi:MAG: HAD-IA family hydrolase [Terracidiphilus sp.]|jgi:phosphoglycolate phosphatase